MADKSETVRVRMLVPMACEANDRNVGDTPAVSAAEAERLIERGFAEPVDGAPKASRGRPPKSQE